MAEIVLTKSEFMDYRHCAKALWLKKRKPDVTTWPTPSLFDRMLMQDGYRVEAVVKELIAEWPDRDACNFQTVFQSPDGLYARADLVRSLENGEIDLFEIKASTSLRSSTGSDHVDDAAFQTLVAERAGHKVHAIHVIHVNKEYVRRGDIIPSELLIIVDVTEDARARLADIEMDADAALRWLARDTIDENGCTCLMIGSRANQCAAFSYFNPGVPDRSIYLLPRISKKKLDTFIGDGRLALDAIDITEVSKLQAPVLAAAKSGEPVIHRDRIRAFLEALQWPLYFYDYETFASAIPIADGLRPQQQMPVQYSLHRLGADGELTHTEFLSDQPGMQRQLVEGLARDICETGSLVSWNKNFEMTCNTAMAALFPEHAEFLADLNDRTIDLMDVFKEDYVDVGFEGSTSIKKVLPVVCPHLQYNEDTVHDGAGAMAAWLELVETSEEAKRARIETELRAYCELDTLAMVEIYRFLKDVAVGQ